MSRLTATICLTLAVLLGTLGCQSTQTSTNANWLGLNIDYQRAVNAFESGDYVKARQLLIPIAESGYRPAQYNLAVLYYQGNGIAQDYSKAAEWFSRAAKQGDAQAQNNLGAMYLKGKGVTYNHKIAESWFTRSADQGTAAAQYNLATIYEGGYDVKQNYEKAAHWYERAADQGHKKSQSRLAYLKKENKAECLSLGKCSISKPTVTFDGAMQALKDGDYSRGFKQLTKLAKSGNRDAQVVLGQMYNKGKGTPPDFRMAMKWWRQAAEQGSMPAQYKLGVMYAAGKGVEVDYVKGLMWLKVAEFGGYEFSGSSEMNKFLFTAIEDRLTSSQIEEAQNLAHECIRKKYKGC